VYLRCNRPRQANDYRESELELVIECEQTYLVAVVLLLFMAADWLRRISVEYRKRPLCSEN